MTIKKNAPAKKTSTKKAASKQTPGKKTPFKRRADMPPVTFYYANTDNDPPAGVKGYPMTPENLAPALVVWLFLTTNPSWIVQFYSQQEDAHTGSVKELADAVGLTEGSVQFILDRAKDSNTRSAMKVVANAFQNIKDAFQGAGSYHPICPPEGTDILKLAPSAWVTNPGTPI